MAKPSTAGAGASAGGGGAFPAPPTRPTARKGKSAGAGAGAGVILGCEADDGSCVAAAANAGPATIPALRGGPLLSLSARHPTLRAALDFTCQCRGAGTGACVCLCPTRPTSVRQSAQRAATGVKAVDWRYFVDATASGAGAGAGAGSYVRDELALDGGCYGCMCDTTSTGAGCDCDCHDDQDGPSPNASVASCATTMPLTPHAVIDAMPPSALMLGVRAFERMVGRTRQSVAAGAAAGVAAARRPKSARTLSGGAVGGSAAFAPSVVASHRAKMMGKRRPQSAGGNARSGGCGDMHWDDMGALTHNDDPLYVATGRDNVRGQGRFTTLAGEGARRGFVTARDVKARLARTSSISAKHSALCDRLHTTGTAAGGSGVDRRDPGRCAASSCVPGQYLPSPPTLPAAGPRGGVHHAVTFTVGGQTWRSSHVAFPRYLRQSGPVRKDVTLDLVMTEY